MKVIDLLLAVPGTGRQSAPRLLERAGLHIHDARIRDLHPTRKKQLLMVLADPSYYPARRYRG
jgi:ribosomal protein S11